jgi:tripartite ATP-independent transporter DctM subunit
MSILLTFLGCLALTLVMGIPVGFCLAISGLALMLLTGNTDPLIIARRMVSGVDNFTLLAIPFFMLAGEIMNKAGIVKDILNCVNAFIGRLRGGLGYVNIFASMFFAGITGSAVADTSALGMLEIPMMTQSGYDKKYSCAITAASSVMGPIIPPSIPMIIYGMITGTSITKLFLAGVIPGVLIALVLSSINWYYAKKYHFPCGKKLPIKEVFIVFIKAVPVLLLPLIILGGVLTGIFTPTEAAAVAVAYAVIIAVTLYKLKLAEMIPVFIQAAKSTAIVMLICATASVVTWLLTISMVPQMIIQYVFKLSLSPLMILFLINIFLLVVGCVLDLVPALFILVPVMAPLAKSIGVDPIHFGAIVVCNLCIGLITPPVGTVLYVCCSVGKIKLESLVKAIAPMLIGIIIVVLTVTYFPQIILFLPGLIK